MRMPFAASGGMRSAHACTVMLILCLTAGVLLGALPTAASLDEKAGRPCRTKVSFYANDVLMGHGSKPTLAP